MSFPKRTAELKPFSDLLESGEPHMVQALPPNGTNHAFDVGSLPRGARRGQHFMDVHVSHLLLEVIAEDRIAVAEGLGVLLIPPQTSEPGLPTSINWVR